MMLSNTYGPKTLLAQQLLKDKYLQEDETFEQLCHRLASTLSDDDSHKEAFLDILLNQRFFPAGRIQSAIGSKEKANATAFNCFVSEKIEDSMESIFSVLKSSALTLKLGGGVGYDFSNIRPKASHIHGLNASASGPVSFMKIYDQMCGTISSSNHRRGAQMGSLRVDHPDIYEFVRAKSNTDQFTNFNLSVLITDDFMEAVDKQTSFDLVFEGKVYETVDANHLWNEICLQTWDYAEPGVLFIDRIIEKNNLHYNPDFKPATCNPCGEIFLFHGGSCLLGSFNLTKYVTFSADGEASFDYELFKRDIPIVVRAQDNVINASEYPLPIQKKAAEDTRRMGLGVTGLANAVEVQDAPYGSEKFLSIAEEIFETMRDTVYLASVDLAKEKGAFPAYQDEFLDSGFAKTLPETIRGEIKKHGIRNSHLLAQAPCGTISLACGDNCSSSIEPTFAKSYDRTIILPDGEKKITVEDFAVANWDINPKTADQVSVDEHVAVLNLASKYVDNSVSKTVNVGASVTFEEFKDVYKSAYYGGAMGCATFRINGKRFGIMESNDGVEEDFKEGAACYIDPTTGKKTCE